MGTCPQPSILGIYCRWFSYEHPGGQSTCGLHSFPLGLPTGKSSESLTETDWLICQEPKTLLTSPTPMNFFISIWTFVCTFYKSFMIAANLPAPWRQNVEFLPLQSSMDLIRTFNRCNRCKSLQMGSEKEVIGTLQ